MSVQNQNLLKPPIPPEHGAWIIFLTPLFTTFAASKANNILFPFVLLLCACFIFLLWNSFVLSLRSQHRERFILWMVIYGLLGAGSFSYLIVSRFSGLWYVSMFGIALTAFLAVRVIKSSQTALRNVTGGGLAVVALTLTAPAMWVVTGNELDFRTAMVWIVHILFFLSGVVFVNMLIKGKTRKGINQLRCPLDICRTSILYHLFLLIAVAATSQYADSPVTILIFLAFLPLWVRQLWGQRIIAAARIPSFKVIGLLEAVWTVWFSLFIVMAILKYLE